MISHIINDQWLEDARENYEQALIEGNRELAEAVLNDMRNYGFGKEADSLIGVVKSEQ